MGFAVVKLLGFEVTAFVWHTDFWPAGVPEGFVFAEVSEDGPGRVLQFVRWVNKW